MPDAVRDRFLPSVTSCLRWGNGPRQFLRFTKAGDPRLDLAHATHFVWSGKACSAGTPCS